MEEAVLLDMSTDDINIEKDTHIKTEKFCTEWACVKKVVKIITLDGQNVLVEELGDKKLIEGGGNDIKNV